MSLSTQLDETGDAGYTHGIMARIHDVDDLYGWVSYNEAEELYVEQDASVVDHEAILKMLDAKCATWLVKHAPNSGRKGVIFAQSVDHDVIIDDVKSDLPACDIIGVFDESLFGLVISNYLNRMFPEHIDEEGEPSVDVSVGTEYLGKRFFFHPL